MLYPVNNLWWRDKRIWWQLVAFFLFVALVFGSVFVPGAPAWLPVAMIALVVVTFVVLFLVGLPKTVRYYSRAIPEFPAMLSGLAQGQLNPTLPRQGLARLPSLAGPTMPGQEWNYGHGTYRGQFFATFSFYASSAAAVSDAQEEFHVAFVETGRDAEVVHVTSAKSGLPLNLDLGGRVSTESHEFNEKWTAYAHDPRVAHALLNPRVIEVLIASKIDARAWVVDSGVVAVVTRHEFGPHNLAAILDELHAVARAIPGVAR